MKNISCRLFLCLAFSIASLFMVRPGDATLGQPADSVESDRIALSAVRGGTTMQNGYTVQEINYGGTAVREYVSSSGIVFAVAWNGIRHPDLTALLGSYTDQYRKTLQQTPRQPGVRHLSVRTDGVVVEKWGHVRDLRGRAYAPDLIPPGLDIDEIR
jgi:hypothetical protein